LISELVSIKGMLLQGW